MRSKIFNFRTFILLLFLCGSHTIWAQDGSPAFPPPPDCPPADTTVCIYIDYPSYALNNCPLEVCLEFTPTPLLSSLCPFAVNTGAWPCATVSPGQTNVPLCFQSPRGNVNSWYTYQIKVREPIHASTMYWPITIGSALSYLHKPGGCHDAVFLMTSDGLHYSIYNDILLH